MAGRPKAVRPFFRRVEPARPENALANTWAGAFSGNFAPGCPTTNRKTIGNHIHRLKAIESQNQAKKWQGMAGTGYTTLNRMFSGTLPLAPL